MNNYKLTAPILTIPCDQLASTTITAAKLDYATSINFAPNGVDTFRVESDGRLFWKGREVESDDELRSAMLEIKAALCGGRR